MNLYFNVKSFTAPSKTHGDNQNQNIVSAKKQTCKVIEYNLGLFNFWPVEREEHQLGWGKRNEVSGRHLNSIRNS